MQKGGQSPPLHLTFRPFGIQLRLLDQGREPIRNRRVAVYALKFPFPSSRRMVDVGTTDKNGRINFPVVPPAQLELLAVGIGPISGVEPDPPKGYTPANLRLGVLKPPHDSSGVITFVFEGRPKVR